MAAIVAMLSPSIGFAQPSTSLQLSAPLNSESAGEARAVALATVFRVICPDKGVQGTGFLHQSGTVITARHVIRDCRRPIVVLTSGQAIGASVTAEDPDLDLALLKPETPIPGQALRISKAESLGVGLQVSTWGFPGGYFGSQPMLTVGYLAGVEPVRTESGKVVAQWVVNAAFNHGNSGGPIVDVSRGEVIGVVDSKLTPLSEKAIGALRALQGQHSGFVYNYTMADGSAEQMSEGQVVALVLDELREQVQLVIGNAITLGDLKTFLLSHGIAP